MKVLVLVNHELTLYNFRRELLAEMIGRGMEVVVSMPPGGRRKFFEGLGCRLVDTELSMHGMNPFRDMKLVFSYIRIIRVEKPDVVLTYTIKPNIYGGMAAAWCRVRCVSTVTGLGAAFEKGWLVRRVALVLYRIGTWGTEALFFQNKTQSDLFERHHVAAGRHVLVAGSGVNLQKHCYEPYPGGEEVRFLFVGRITRDKGIDELADAMRMVKRRSEVPVGLELLGDIEAGYEEKVRQWQDEGLLVFHGRHENVHDYIRNCHAVVLPSYHEGLANVLLEAAACGRPVIASDVDGCRETFDEGASGLGFKPRNVDALAEAMMKFIHLSSGRREAMGRTGREKMEREFDRREVNRVYVQTLLGA